MHSRWSFRPMLFALIVTGLAVRPVLADTDEIEGPWGTITATSPGRPTRRTSPSRSAKVR
jgi:hypothetical protein